MSDIYNYICNNLEYFFDRLYLENFIYNLADKYYFEYHNNKKCDINEIIKIYDCKAHKLSNYQNLIVINRKNLLLLLKSIKKKELK